MELIEQKLSDSTIDYWNENESNIRNNKFKELIRDFTRNDGLLISTIDLRDQLIFLQYLTGCTIDHLSPKSRFVRKDTYYLLKTIGEFRNYRQHISQEAVEFHFVVNTILSINYILFIQRFLFLNHKQSYINVSEKNQYHIYHTINRIE